MEYKQNAETLNFCLSKKNRKSFVSFAECLIFLRSMIMSSTFIKDQFITKISE